MKVSKFELSATIPTGQYANVIPTVTVDVEEGENVEQAKTLAMDHIESVSAMYAEKDKLILKRNSTAPAGEVAREMEDFLDGQKIFFYEGAHRYMDEEGLEYESGSKFAHRFTPEFDKSSILPRYANKYGVEEEDVESLWNDKGEASTTLGTAVHKALEVYGRQYLLSQKLGKEPMDCIHPLLRPIVESFYTKERIQQLLKGNMVWEAAVVDKTLKRCGQLDLVTIVDRKKKILDIEDYKTNIDIYKDNPGTLLAPYKALPNMPVASYTLQLSFYKDVIEAKGWKVRNLNLHWLKDDHTWEEVKLTPVNTIRTKLNLDAV